MRYAFLFAKVSEMMLDFMRSIIVIDKIKRIFMGFFLVKGVWRNL